MAQTITQAAGMTYRTKLMTYDAADAFRRCLQANGRFDFAMIAQSRAAKAPTCHYVTFRPSNPARLADMLTREQDKNAARADAEGDAYIFIEKAGAAGWWVFNPKSGCSWEVSDTACSCPHVEHRLSYVPGTACKHRVALLRGQGTYLRAEETQPPARTERETRAWCAANVDRDFPNA